MMVFHPRIMTKMKLGSCVVVLVLLAWTASMRADGMNVPAIIPLPEKMDIRDGAFNLQPETKIVVDAKSEDVGAFLAKRLSTSVGRTFPVQVATEILPEKGNIYFTTQNANPGLGAEGYDLTIDTQTIIIRAPTQAGLFYGAQSLLQLFPPEVLASKAMKPVNWQVPCVHIEDQPRFKWRGMLLDVSRHFFDKQEVEKLLDVMALLKMNTFHWHLVDNDGWRIEVKKYPRLTEVGAWRKDIGYGLSSRDSTAYGPDGRYGGFYTQDDIREMVQYANVRHITIVPEIELPGHSAAALTAYPEMRCDHLPNNGVYCAGNDQVFAFLEDVLTEVFALFPGKYVHIGGDEVSKANWKKCPLCQERMKQEGLKNEQELQSYFIKRINSFVIAHGRSLVGWSEIRQGGLPEGSVVMDWIGGGKESAAEGHDVVMTPGTIAYFDHYQSLDYSTEPVAIGCYSPLSGVYSLEPVPPGLTLEGQSRILGPQGSVWTEYIASTSYLEYMIFPRLCALAEVAWSQKAARNWNDFNRRLQINNQRLDVLGVNYRVDDSVTIGQWSPSQFSATGTILECDITKEVTKPNNASVLVDDEYRPSMSDVITEPGKCHITFDYSDGAGLKIDWVSLLENGKEISRDTHAGYSGPIPRDLAARDAVYVLSLPETKRGAIYSIQAHVSAVDGKPSSGRIELQISPRPVFR